MLAVLRPGGAMATVMPHGVLFRGGAEQEIRASLLKEDLLEAVIGLPPNLFYGTGIPACILVLRAPHGKSPERQGRVLFINADAEYYAGRAQNYLRPEHSEKIVSTCEAFRDVPGYARVVAVGELGENGYNLNIRRYADNAPPPEPHDVRTHLLGGVPWAEVEMQRPLFDAVSLDPAALLVPRVPLSPAAAGERMGEGAYLDFSPDLAALGREGRAQIKARIEADPGVQARAAQLRAAFAAWWAEQTPRLAALPGSNNLSLARTALLDSFVQALLPVGLLDRFQVAGVVASWWSEIQYDLKTLAAQGFAGLVDSWIASLRAAVEGEGGNVAARNGSAARSGSDPLEHPLVQRLLPEYLERLVALAARVADLKTQIAEQEEQEEDDGDGSGESVTRQGGDGFELRQDVATLRRQLTADRRALKAAQDELLDRLDARRAALTGAQAQAMVLEIERERLAAELERYAAARRQQAIAVVENCWDKYHEPLQKIEAEWRGAQTQLKGFLEELGYA